VQNAHTAGTISSNATGEYDDVTSDDWSGSNIIVYRDEDGVEHRVDRQSPAGTINSNMERGASNGMFATPPISPNRMHNNSSFGHSNGGPKAQKNMSRPGKLWRGFLITLAVLAVLAVLAFLFFPRGPSVVDLTAAFSRPLVAPYPFTISKTALTLSLTMDVSLYSSNYYKLALDQIDLSVNFAFLISS